MKILLKELQGSRPRVQAVLMHLVNGKAEKEIARELDVSHSTVHSHIKGIYRQLGVHSHRELVRIVIARLAEKVRRPDDDPHADPPTEPLVL